MTGRGSYGSVECPPNMRVGRDAAGDKTNECVKRTCADFTIRADGTCTDDTGLHGAAENLWLYNPTGKCVPPPPSDRLKTDLAAYANCGRAGFLSGTTAIAIGAGLLGVAVIGYYIATRD